MTKKIISLFTIILLTAGHSFGACDLAIMFSGNNPKLDMAIKLENNLSKSLKKLNKKNTAKLISTPSDASYSDYFLFLSQTYSGVRVAINYILLNNTFYVKEYRNNSFTSSEQLLAQISNDIETGALNSMNLCK